MPSDEKGKVKEIRQLDVQEVSLVDRAANRRKFLVLKQEDLDMADEKQPDLAQLLESMDAETQELVVKLLGEDADDERVKEELEKAKLSPKAMAAVRTALRALNAVKDELPGNIMRMLASLGGYSYPGPEKAMHPDEEDEAEKGMGSVKDKDKMKKDEGASADAGAGNDGAPEAGDGEEGKEEKPMLKADGTIDWDAVPEGLRPVLKAIEERHAQTAKEAEELKKALAAERDRIRKAEFVAKAEKEFGALPGTAEEVGALLKEADEKLSGENVERLHKLLKAANERFAEVLKEKGSGASDEGEAQTAADKLEAIAKELARKENITFEQAFVKAMDLHPDLAEQEREERSRTH